MADTTEWLTKLHLNPITKFLSSKLYCLAGKLKTGTRTWVSDIKSGRFSTKTKLLLLLTWEDKKKKKKHTKAKVSGNIRVLHFDWLKCFQLPFLPPPSPSLLLRYLDNICSQLSTSWWYACTSWAPLFDGRVQHLIPSHEHILWDLHWWA